MKSILRWTLLISLAVILTGCKEEQTQPQPSAEPTAQSQPAEAV